MLLFKAIVGSKLHRLDTPDSDEDVKGVLASPLRKLASPFVNLDRAHESSDRDEVLYELRHFCGLAAKGNPTVLEVLWSDLLLRSVPLGDELRANRQKFLDAEYVRAAHLGYAQSQVKKLEKQGYVEDDRRKRKALIARVRVLAQGLQLMQDRDFNPNISEKMPNLHDELLLVKNGVEPTIALEQYAAELDAALMNASADFKVDIEWIENFCERVYRVSY